MPCPQFTGANSQSDLRERGIGIPDLVTLDAHTDLRAALKACFAATTWQRCQFHLQQNAQQYITRQELKSKVAADIATIFKADDRARGEIRLASFVKTYPETQPGLAEWAETNLPESFAVFSLPEAHRKKTLTSNACETLNSQLKRRPRDVGRFPNEASLYVFGREIVAGRREVISEAWFFRGEHKKSRSHF